MTQPYMSWEPFEYEKGKKYGFQTLQALEERTEVLKEEAKPLFESLEYVWDRMKESNYIWGLGFQYNQLLNYVQGQEVKKK